MFDRLLGGICLVLYVSRLVLFDLNSCNGFIVLKKINQTRELYKKGRPQVLVRIKLVNFFNTKIMFYVPISLV